MTVVELGRALVVWLLLGRFRREVVLRQCCSRGPVVPRLVTESEADFRCRSVDYMWITSTPLEKT